MALRRKDKKVRKLNRTTFRRPAGRTAEFFDLRGTEENTGIDTGANTGSNTGTNYSTNRRSGYSGSSSSGPSLPDSRRPELSLPDSRGRFSSFSRFSASSGDRDDSPRPYRERHRVEVNTQNTRDGYFYPDQEKTDRDMYGGRDSYGGGQRIVHGNVPGNRSGQEKPADQKEISSDLIYGGGVSRSWRSTRSSAGGSDTGSRSSYGRSSSDTGSRTSSYGRSSTKISFVLNIRKMRNTKLFLMRQMSLMITTRKRTSAERREDSAFADVRWRSGRENSSFAAIILRWESAQRFCCF